jgi:hypothetical protein
MRLKEVKQALTILEKFLRTKENSIPPDLKKRAETCLAALSTTPCNDSAIPNAPSTTSSNRETPTGFPSHTEAEPVQQLAILGQHQTSKRLAEDPESLEASQDQDPSRKRSKTDSERDENVRGFFEVLKADKSSISKLIASSSGSVGHFYGVTSDIDPREAHINRLHQATAAERLDCLLAVLSLYKHFVRTKSSEKQLAAKFRVSISTIKHTKNYGRKSNDFVDEAESAGILWCLVSHFGKWRYLAKNSIIEIVKLIKEDQELKELVESSSQEWLKCQTEYEAAFLEYRKMHRLGVVAWRLSNSADAQCQPRIQEVDGSGDESSSQVLGQTGEICDHTSSY